MSITKGKVRWKAHGVYFLETGGGPMRVDINDVLVRSPGQELRLTVAIVLAMEWIYGPPNQELLDVIHAVDEFLLNTLVFICPTYQEGSRAVRCTGTGKLGYLDNLDQPGQVVTNDTPDDEVRIPIPIDVGVGKIAQLDRLTTEPFFFSGKQKGDNVVAGMMFSSPTISK